jgi:hypothetical protein
MVLRWRRHLLRLSGSLRGGGLFHHYDHHNNDHHDYDNNDHHYDYYDNEYNNNHDHNIEYHDYDLEQLFRWLVVLRRRDDYALLLRQRHLRDSRMVL